MRISPRVFIYLIAIIVCAWLMHRTSNRQLQTQPATDVPPPTRLATTVKEADLSSPATTSQPLLIILSADESTLPSDTLRARLQPYCQVIHLQTTTDTKRHFKAEKVPMAILFDRESEEISRLQHPWSDDDLLALAKQAATKSDE